MVLHPPGELNLFFWGGGGVIYCISFLQVALWETRLSILQSCEEDEVCNCSAI